MKLNKLKKYLGRIPNKVELEFINAFKKSYDIQSAFNNEIAFASNYIANQSRYKLIAVNKNDNRGIIENHILNKEKYKKVKLFKNDIEKLIVGINYNNLKKEKIFLGSLFLLKGKNNKTLINEINKSTIINNIVDVHKCGLGYSIYKLLKVNNCGICLNISSANDLFMKSMNGILIQVGNESLKEYELFNKEKSIFIGSFTNDKFLKIRSKSNNISSLPIQILDFTLDKNSVLNEFKIQTKISSYEVANLKEKKSYNKDLKELLVDINHKEKVKFIKINNYKYGYSTHDNDHISYNDYYMQSISLIANASRRLACNGIVPETATGFLSIPNENNEQKGSFLKGVNNISKHLNINMGYFSFNISNSLPSGKFYVFGKSISKIKINNKFNIPGNFISIIGTHIGELGGSRYFIKNKLDYMNKRPYVDLNAECRLQNSIIKGIQGNLFESIRPISGGGIASAVALSLMNKSKLGARIHFTSNLSPSEILFGETQGLVLVTLKEENLMPLERLCMKFEIANTTIGRVTNDGFLTINKKIEVNVSDL